MAYDGIVLKNVINEMQSLVGAKVNKIFEPDKNTIILSVYNGSNFAMLIDISANNYRLNLTTTAKPNPLVAPNFCMVLRKYLINSKITAIYTIGLERIAYIEFESFNEMNDKVKRTLVIELMGKYSNVTLLNEQNYIIDAVKKFDGNGISRDIMPARKYILPESDKLDYTSMSKNDFVNKVIGSDYKTIESALCNIFTGISKFFVLAMIENLKISNTISESSLKEIYDYINISISNNNILKDISNTQNVSCFNVSANKYSDNTLFYSHAICINYKNNYTVIPNKSFSENHNNVLKENIDSRNIPNSKSLEENIDNCNITNSKSLEEHINNHNIPNSKSLEENNFNKENIFQVNFFLDDFYNARLKDEEYQNFRNSLLKIINGILDKISKKLDNINDKINSCDDMEKYKLFGELIIANIYKFNEKDLVINDTKEINVVNYYDNSNISIPINNSISLSKNADKYFKKYNKMKNTLAVTKQQKNETEKELDYLESLLYELDNCNNLTDLDSVYTEISENILFNDYSKLTKFKKKNYTDKKIKDSELESLKNYIRIKIDNYDVCIGKNNKQNDYLTKKVANENDLWFHVKDIHGSHLILRCNGDTPKISTIEKCASLAAYYSKAKFSSHVPVDYTLIKNVKKPNGAVPGYVIYTNNKTIYAEPHSAEII